MVYMITTKGLKDLLKKKVNGHSLPNNWEKEFDEYVESKRSMLKKDEIFGQKEELVEKESEKEIAELLKIKGFLEKEPVEMPMEMPSGGIVKSGIAIIPVSPHKYVYNICYIKGIAQLQKMPETEKWYIEIDETGHQIFLKDKPIKEFCYELPDEDLVKEWVKGKKSNTTKEIWDDLDKYVRLFVDVEDVFYNVMKLFIMQTWLKDVMNISFYVCVMGAWGAGKTAVMETMHYVCKNSLLGQPTKAFMARMIDKQGITICFDELDTVVGREEDTDLLSMFRLGYRKGQKYPIMNRDLEPVFFDVFGPKVYTVKTVSEGALLQRALPITTSESTDATLPAINSIKPEIAKLLRDRLYLWYLDNIVLYVDSVSCVDSNSIDSSSRESLFNFVCVNAGATEASEQRYGRSAELGFVVSKLAFLLGVDLGKKWTTKIFEIKKDAEEEQQETNDIQLLRDILAERYKELAPLPEMEGWRSQDGFVKISHKEVLGLFNEKMKREKFTGASNKDFSGFLRELGFDIGNSKRKIRVRVPGEVMGIDGWPVRLALIFSPSVIKKLQITEIESQSRLTEEKV